MITETVLVRSRVSKIGFIATPNVAGSAAKHIMVNGNAAPAYSCPANIAMIGLDKVANPTIIGKPTRAK